MSGLFKNEWKKIRVSVFCTIVLLTALTSILSCTIYQNYSLTYDLEAWEVGTEIIGFLFPLFVTIPLCWTFYYERKNNFMSYVSTRVSVGKYLLAKWSVSAISAFLILFIPFFLSAIAAMYVKEPIVPYIPSAEAGITPFNHVFLGLFTKTPLLYALLLSVWRGFIGILVMSFGFALSLYISNIFVVLTGSFIYIVLENFILAILGMAQYRLATSFDPTILSENVISASSFFVGPAILVVVTLCTWLYFSVFKHSDIVKM